MAAYLDTQIALDSRLDALGDGVPIAWENVHYKPIKDTTYYRPTNLPASSTLQIFNGTQLNPGIYQIDIFTSLDKGPGANITLVDAMYTHFKGSIVLTENTTDVLIKSVSRTQATRVDSWFMSSITVSYQVYA